MPPTIRESQSVQSQPQADLRSLTKERRLFVQLQVFGNVTDPAGLKEVLKASSIESVLYLNLHDPQGVGLLLMSEDPTVLMNEARAILSRSPRAGLRHQQEMTLVGMTYPSGHESDLNDWLLARPRRILLNAQWPWVIWYPLRRKPEFALLEPSEQRAILSEHAKLGRTYGEAELATDIRLCCYGLDRNDNEFVLGLVGPTLLPLSCLIQDMRKTQQTAKYIQSMGPFFVGKVYWQSLPKNTD